MPDFLPAIPSPRTCEAAGLFARLADLVDRGRATEAIDAHRRLSSLGFVVEFRQPQVGELAIEVEKAVSA